MDEETVPAAAQAFWNQVLENIDRDADTIHAQVEAARDQYAELVSAFRLLAAYVHFLHGTLLGVTPFPPSPGTPPLVGFLAEICKRDRLLCDCAKGDAGACRALGVHAEPIAVELTSCEALWQLYREAVERAIRRIQSAFPGRPVYVDEGILRQSDPAVHVAWQSLVAQRCVDVEYLAEYPPP
jgi:hypothetical protein